MRRGCALGLPLLGDGVGRVARRIEDALDVASRLAVAHHEVAIAALLHVRLELVERADDELLGTVGTLPDRERRAPVPLATYRPILHACEPLAHASISNVLGLPVNLAILGKERTLQVLHADIPGVTRVVDEPGLAAPAEGIAVLVLARIKKEPAHCQVLHNLYRNIVINYLSARESARSLDEAAFGIHEVDFGQPNLRPKLEVLLAVHDRRVHDAGATLGGHKICGVALERCIEFRPLALWRERLCILVQWPVSLPYQHVCVGHTTPSLTKHARTRISKDDALTFSLIRTVHHLLINRECDVTMQGPRRRRPGE